MTRLKVLKRLVRFAQPVLQRERLEHARCILATAVGVDALAAFGIPARPLSVDVWVVNQPWLDWRDRDPEGPQPADAWLLAGGVGQPKDAPTAPPLVPRSLKPWDGHLVVEVPSMKVLLDLDLRAMARPTKGITLPDAAAFDWDGVNDQTYRIPTGGAIRYAAQRDDRSWEQANDWKRQDWRKTLFVDPLVRAIRKGEPR